MRARRLAIRRHTKLRDIRRDNRPFGGVTLVNLGDLRQNPPVIPCGINRAVIVGQSLKRDPRWHPSTTLRLSTNVRLRGAGRETIEFANRLENPGDGTSGKAELAEFGVPYAEGRRFFRFPADMVVEHPETPDRIPRDSLIDLRDGVTDVGDNMILTTTKVLAEHVNESVGTGCTRRAMKSTR